MKKILIALFILLALAQWAVPGSIIWKREEVLKKGETFRFETEPVDPSNPFKGRYISLNFKEDVVTVPKQEDFERGQEVYVLLKVENGFARIKSLSTSKPPANTDYIDATVNYIGSESPDGLPTVHLDYPFEEFYMDEYKAPKAEDIYNKSVRDTTQKTYAQIKVWKGRAVIENVFIGNTPIGELIDR